MMGFLRLRPSIGILLSMSGDSSFLTWEEVRCESRHEERVELREDERSGWKIVEDY